MTLQQMSSNGGATEREGQRREKGKHWHFVDGENSLGFGGC